MERFSNCLYREVCDYKQECRNACVRYCVTKYMLEKSRIPKSKWGINKLVPDNCDVKAFEALAKIRKSIVEFTRNGNSLYIYSNTCGNGKTTWAIKLMLQYFNDVWEFTGFNARGVFVNVNSFLYECKQVINKPNEDFENFKELISDVDLVIWDDIAASKLSEYDYNLLFTFINQRNFNGKSNIYTGNIFPEDLHKCLGDRLASRVLDGAKIQLKGKDKRVDDTTTDFIKDINI